MRPHAQIAQGFGNVTRLAHLSDEVLTVGLRAQCGAATSWLPHWCDDRSRNETPGADFIRQPLYAVIINFNTDVWIEEKYVHAIEADAVNFGTGCHIEHSIEVDGRFSPWTAFTHKTGPHGVVELGEGVVVLRTHIVRLESIEASVLAREGAIGKWEEG